MSRATLSVIAGRSDPESTRMLGIARTVTRDNKGADVELVVVDAHESPAQAVGAGAVVVPTLIVTVGQGEGVKLSGVHSRRAVLQLLLPLLYDEDTALAELRRQLDSPMEEFPRRTQKRVAKIGQQARIRMYRDIPLFDHLSSRQLKALADASHEIVLGGATIIIEEGDPGDEFFVVAHGKVEVRHGTKVAATLGRGESFGEMSLIDEGPRTATVASTEPTTLLAIDRGTFQALLQSHPDISFTLLQRLAGRLRADQSD